MHYYLDESKKFSGAFIQGYANGKHRYYYESGSIKEDQYFEMGRREKLWKKYDEEGNIIISINYSNDRIVRINGIKVNLEEIE